MSDDDKTTKIVTLTRELAEARAACAGLRELDAAFQDSEFDLSPCPDCGAPVLCIPEGLPAQCPACYAKENAK